MATVEQLRRLSALRERGALTADEYARAKRDLLQNVPEAEHTKDIPEESNEDLRPMLSIAVLSAIVLGLMSMLVFGASASIAGTIGVATLGGFTVLLYRSLADDDDI